MKTHIKLFVLLNILIYCFNLSAQVTPVISGLNFPQGFHLDDNTLYFSEFSEHKISSINLTEINPDVIDVTLTNGGNRATLKVGDELYVCDQAGYRVAKINLSDESPNLTTVINDLNGATDLLLIGNNLYVALQEGGEIIKIDITVPEPEITSVATMISGALKMKVIGTDMYVSAPWASAIYKLDLTQSLPLTPELLVYVEIPTGLEIVGNDLYIASDLGNHISKVDITAAEPILTTVIDEGLDRPFDIVYHEEAMYIANAGGGSILKFNIDPIILSESITNTEIKVFPNPTTGLLQLQNVNADRVMVLDNLGKVMLVENRPNHQIDISDLATGLYFLQVVVGKNIYNTKVIKE